MYKIIVDTETSGLPTAWDAGENAINIWPRIVEIAWIVLDENDNIVITEMEHHANIVPWQQVIKNMTDKPIAKFIKC